ncbi:DUF401 family protein [Desulfovibrio sp. OttesenSCG-928-C06]|nr:DUF401 family protein [Desulfovibrio sp. OttesenSCG-928-C06]
MPELSDTTVAFIKLAAIFLCMLVMLRLRITLWITVLSGCLLLALLTGLPFNQWLEIPLGTATSAELLILEIMLCSILVLSGVQGVSGQSQRLVESIERYIRWPRVRLVLFPAMVGFLPMPGGALFSCPMLEAASQGMDITPQRKTLINYWFRHIWEVSWPLYPGYVLTSALLGLPLTSLMKYTFPLVIIAICAGWFFLMRDIRVPEAMQTGPEDGKPRGSLGAILYEALPLIITIAGAGVCGVILGRTAPEVPGQVSFIISALLGVATALWQGRGRLSKPLGKIVFSRDMLRMIMLMFTIFLFKNIISASGIITDISHIGGNKIFIVGMFILLPLFCGMLIGIMVGYVGACFPILQGIIEQSGMQEYTLPLLIMALVAGNVGMMFTPLHICLAVTCEFFKVSFADIIRGLSGPLIAHLFCGIAWSAALFGLGAHF